jgi:hypothetical protein
MIGREGVCYMCGKGAALSCTGICSRCSGSLNVIDREQDRRTRLGDPPGGSGTEGICNVCHCQGLLLSGFICTECAVRRDHEDEVRRGRKVLRVDTVVGVSGSPRATIGSPDFLEQVAGVAEHQAGPAGSLSRRLIVLLSLHLGLGLVTGASEIEALQYLRDQKLIEPRVGDDMQTVSWMVSEKGSKKLHEMSLIWLALE